MSIVHDHTKVPVPKLLAWNADASNPVGAEYVVTERATGCQLTEKWDEMDEEGHVELVKNLCRLEGELAAIAFPAYGSLYLQESMDDGDKYEPLAPELDPFGRFCIGPSCRRDETESVQARFDQGPCEYPYATYFSGLTRTYYQGSLYKHSALRLRNERLHVSNRIPDHMSPTSHCAAQTRSKSLS